MRSSASPSLLFATRATGRGFSAHVYAQAGLKAPDVKKIEMIEGAFLIRYALAAKGYQSRPLAGGTCEKKKTEDLLNEEGGIAGAHLAALERSGAQAVVIAGGGRDCEDVEVCVAKVKYALWT